MADNELGARWRPRLREVQDAIRQRLRRRMAEQDAEQNAAVARDDDVGGDTIFAIDIDADRVLIEHCERWADAGESFVLVGEGVEPDGSHRFGSGPSTARLIVDPIDGTRGLMFDKRSAWSLAAVAPDHGDATRLSDVVVAAMTELPTTRQTIVDDPRCPARARSPSSTARPRARHRTGASDPAQRSDNATARIRHGVLVLPGAAVSSSLRSTRTSSGGPSAAGDTTRPRSTRISTSARAVSWRS